jgi:hypothetical protein
MGLVLGAGAATGFLFAALPTPAGPLLFDDVTVVGAGLTQVRLVTEPPSMDRINRIRANQPREAAAYARWSRTIGALGEQAWRHLRRQHIVIVGDGRSGSMAAATLARSGVRRLTLLDPDVVEAHNLGEMEVVQGVDLGVHKVTALARMLAGEVDAEVTALAGSVDSLTAACAIRGADALVSCAADPLARLLTSIIGAAYLRPVLDIGTGVFGDAAARRMGLDVRLLLPEACLVCGGGVPGLGRDGPGDDARASEDPDAWRRRRAGSLRTLNQVAVGLGLRLLEDLVAGRVHGSTWLRVDFDTDGIPRLERLPLRPDPQCPVCRVAACGDAVLPLMPRLVAEATTHSRELGTRRA